MIIPVIKKTGRKDEKMMIHMLDLKDVWFVSVERGKNVVYHTDDGDYYQPSSMEQVWAFLKMHGYTKTDRGIVVNLNNVKRFDEDYGKLYFEKEVNRYSKFATVAFSNIRKLKQLLQRFKHDDADE